MRLSQLVMLHHIANRVEFMKFASMSNIQVSLIIVCLETTCIFYKSFLPVIITLQRFSLRNLQHRSVSFVHACSLYRLCSSVWDLNESCLPSDHIRAEQFWTIMNLAFRRKKSGIQANYTIVQFLNMDCFFMSFIICRCFVILTCQQTVQVIEGVFFRKSHEHAST